MRTLYKPFYYSGDAAGFIPESFAFTAPARAFTYDPLGRPETATDYRGGVTSFVYHPALLSVDVRDPEQQYGAAHEQAFTTLMIDGHGRTVRAQQHFGDGPLGQAGTLTTDAEYRATGEPVRMTLSRQGATLYSRSMRYDSLGRLVFNSEPNTNDGGAGGWTYAYNDNGELVATSDARGCGENFLRDRLGRIVAEDYSPCESTQAPYTAPKQTGYGTEVLRVYDPVTGRLTDGFDRAQRSHFEYDARGRLKIWDRWIANGSGGPALAKRYTNHMFGRTFSYFESNRVASASTGADAPELLDASGLSQASTTYDLQGTLAALDSSYGTLIAAQTSDSLGNLLHQALGDAAQTTADVTYDPNENVSTYRLGRDAGPWVPASAYTNAPPSPNDTANTFQGELTNRVLLYDHVDNPISLSDLTAGSAWNDGAKPVTKTFGYTDDYRLVLSHSIYATSDGTDQFVSPYFAEEGAGDATYPPVASPSTKRRVRGQAYRYDWLGNLRSSADDAGDFVDRSLGILSYGSPTLGPNQLRTAGEAGQGLVASYDKAGHLTSWTSGSGGAVADEYVYLWNEVGQLSAAYRRNALQPGPVVERFAYDSGGQRVAFSRQEFPHGALTYTVQVFDSLLLRNAEIADNDFRRDSSTEEVFISAGSSLRAHVLYNDELPAVGSSTHVFLEPSDPRGSTEFVIDRDSGEIVERASYLDYGAVESDFRPTRWSAYREQMRYDGHEDNAEVGLLYAGARYYAPQLNHWASPDPLAIHGLEGDPNPYAFVRGSPWRHTDRYGLQDADPQTKEAPPPDLQTQADYYQWLSQTPYVADGAESSPADCNNSACAEPQSSPGSPLDVPTEEEADVLLAQRAIQEAFEQRFEELQEPAAIAESQRVASTVGLVEAIPGPGTAVGVYRAVSPESPEGLGGRTLHLLGAAGGVAGVLPSGAFAAEGLETAAAGNAEGLIANGRNYINSARVIERAAAEPGPFHNFPGSLDPVILEQGEQKLSVGFFQQAKAGYGASGVQYSLPGAINGQAGVFQIGTRLSTSGNVELIMHRFFRPLP
ncbi:MAG: RHS repeat domain-containing protein [Polyangiaceae bacterium]